MTDPPQDFWLQQNALAPLLTLPAIAGHEGSGRILSIGSAVSDKSLKPGDAVLLSFTACGSCTECTHSSSSPPNFSRCAAFAPLNISGSRRADGSSPATLAADGKPVVAQFFGHSSFSRVSAVHELCVVKCPREEDLAMYAPMGCGYQTGAGTVLNVLKPGEGHTVVVFGAGSVGCAAIMAAASVPVKQLIAVDVVERKLALAKEVGATDVLDSSKCEVGGVVEEIKKLTGGRGVDYAIDTTGVSAVVEQMLDCLAYGGTAASVGVPPRGDTIMVGSGSFFSGKKTWVAVAEGDAHPPEVRQTYPRVVVVKELRVAMLTRDTVHPPTDRASQARKVSG